MNDIVTKLRKFAAIQPQGNGPSQLAEQAADEIERLRAEVSSLWTVNRAKDRRIDYLVRHTPFWQEYT